MIEAPDPLQGHRYEIHVTDEPKDGQQFCMRCGGALAVGDNVTEMGTLWPYILGPKYNGYAPPNWHVLKYGEMCTRKEKV